MTVNLLAFAGSTRKDSFNKKLVRLAAKQAEKLGAEVNLIDLRDYPMPLYDGDLEAESGLPENSLKVREMMLQSDGLLMSCPEYNYSITGVWKNTIDWLSRKVDPDEPMVYAFQNKVIGLLSASPAAVGGLRSLINVRYILTNLGCVVVPKQFSLSSAHQKFNDQDELKDEFEQQLMVEVVEQLVTMTKQLQP